MSDKPPAVATPAPKAGTGRLKYDADDEILERPFDRGQFQRLLSFLVPYKRPLVVTFLLMLVNSAAMLAGPYLMKTAIDQYIMPKNLAGLNLIAIIYIAVHFISWISAHYRVKIISIVGQGVLADLRHKLFDHIQKLSFRFFDGRPAGKILVRLTNDVSALNQLLTQGIINTLTDVMTLIGIIVIIVSMHARLALISFVTLPLLILIATRLRGVIRDRWRQVRRRLSMINAHLNETLQGVRVTQAFVREKRNMAWFDGINRDYVDTWMRAIRVDSIFGPLVELTGAIGTMAVYWFGTNLLLKGGISIGTLIAFTSYLGRFWQPISNLSAFYNQLLVAMASSERVFEILDTKPDVTDRPAAKTLPTIRGRVDFKDVSFSYDNEREVLRDINFSVEPGQTVALVGHTGAGKTSIINLLARFYETVDGRIEVDGVDIRQTTLVSLRSQFGLVLQDTFIFKGTVRENIRYGRLDATDEEIEEAAKAVHAHAFIARMPQGYDTELGERGARLSVGQKQLLSFARALLADPRILILDEATSSIDTETEILVQDALRKLLEGRTSFVVAHRLSTIRGADQIIVMENGRIVEVGTHDSLMRDRGLYHSLLRAQFRTLEEAAGAE